MNEKIGFGQLTVLMVLSRVFSEASLLPGEFYRHGMQRFTVVTVSFLITALLYLPLYTLSRRYPDRDMLAVLGGGRHTAALTIPPVLAAFFLIMTGSVIRMYRYLSGTVFSETPAPAIFLLAAGVVFYSLYGGIQTSARISVIAATGHVILIILLFAGLASEIKPERIYPVLYERPGDFAYELISELSLNSEMLIFAFAAPCVKDRQKYCVPLYLLISYALIILMIFLYNTVLGELLDTLGFPFFTLSSVANVNILNRLNGIDSMVWNVTALLKLCVSAAACALMSRHMTENEKNSRIFAGAVSAVSIAAAAYSVFAVSEKTVIDGSVVCGALTVGTAFLIPLAAVLADGLRLKRREAAKT